MTRECLSVVPVIKAIGFTFLVVKKGEDPSDFLGSPV